MSVLAKILQAWNPYTTIFLPFNPHCRYTSCNWLMLSIGIFLRVALGVPRILFSPTDEDWFRACDRCWIASLPPQCIYGLTVFCFQFCSDKHLRARNRPYPVTDWFQDIVCAVCTLCTIWMNKLVISNLYIFKHGLVYFMYLKHLEAARLLFIFVTEYKHLSDQRVTDPRKG